MAGTAEQRVQSVEAMKMLTAQDLNFNGSLLFKDETMSSILSQRLHSDSFHSKCIQGCRRLQVLIGQASPPTHLFITL